MRHIRTVGGMMPIHSFCRFVLAVLLVLAGITGQAAPTYGSSFSFSNDFDKYGTVQNFTCPTGEMVCGAIAAINSFTFLQNEYPDIYDGRLVVHPTEDAAAFAITGWQAPGGPHRDGYYQRPGIYQTYLDTKMDWINDFAPETTKFSSMFGSAGFPTIRYLAREIKRGEDVEFFVKNIGIPDDPNTPEDESVKEGSFFHVLTLTGIACDARGNCNITYQDPQAPTTPFTAMVDKNGDRLEFDDANRPDRRLFIDAAFSESPIPEPSTILLMGIGFACSRVVAARRKRRP